MRIEHLTICLVFSLAAPLALGRNVDLSTVPQRKTVQLTIYNSEDLTLVRETRLVTFKKGINPLQFSWANTLIDPSSVEMKFLSSADKLEILDTTFPHDKPQMLYWNVKSDFDGQATIQITYFTSGITWSADYTVIADVDETALGVDGFVRVYNNSGEEYEDAQVRLVVGKINLVEKIAQLARISMLQAGQLQGQAKGAYRRDAMKEFLDKAELTPAPATAPPADMPAKPKEIVKEGLSEYFIFTIEGTETVPNGWSKRMRSIAADAAPVKIQYRYRPREYGDQLVRMYLLTNDVPSKLGTAPMPDGVWRVFRANGRDGLSYLTQQTVKYIPIGEKIELNLGPDPEVLFELIKLRAWRDNIWMHIGGTDVFRRVEDGAIQIEVNSSVTGWDEHVLYAQRIRNYSGKRIEVEVRRTYGGHVTFRANLPNQKLFDFQTVQYTVDVDAGKRIDFPHEVITHQGRNHKQNNVTLQKAEVAP